MKKQERLKKKRDREVQIARNESVRNIVTNMDAGSSELISNTVTSIEMNQNPEFENNSAVPRESPVNSIIDNDTDAANSGKNMMPLIPKSKNQNPKRKNKNVLINTEFDDLCDVLETELHQHELNLKAINEVQKDIEFYKTKTIKDSDDISINSIVVKQDKPTNPCMVIGIKKTNITFTRRKL